LNRGAQKILYNLCSDALIDGVEAGQLTEDDESKSAEYVLQLDLVSTVSELRWFLEALSAKWAIHSKVHQKFVLNEMKNMSAEDRKKLLLFRSKKIQPDYYSL
jgi:hypothetical protein